MALRALLGATNNTPECAVSPLHARRKMDVLKKLRKIRSLPPNHLLQVSLTRWQMEDSLFEHETMPTKGLSFFGYAYKAHFELYQHLPATSYIPVNQPLLPRPWDQPIAGKSDPHQEFRLDLRKRIRKQEQEDYDSAQHIDHYKALKPTCLPIWPHQSLPSHKLSAILFKLRAGYCVGSATHILPYKPCPGCGQTDSIKHFLLDCPSFSQQRLRMISQAPALQGKILTLSLLLGRPEQLSAKELKQVALAVAKFVVRCRRVV